MSARLWANTPACSREDYVYEKRAGSGIVVYVIDNGVQVDVKNVSPYFHNRWATTVT
jgi:hypothetical protein